MKCRKCDYPLWNLTEPRCPECGEPFDVMSFWFEPGSVLFRCPYCKHPHVGKDLRGLPFDAGRCEGCGQMLVVEQMPVEPAPRRHEMEVKSDADFSLLNRKRTPGQKRTMIVVAIVVGVLGASWFLLMYLRSV